MSYLEWHIHCGCLLKGGTRANQGHYLKKPTTTKIKGEHLLEVVYLLEVDPLQYTMFIQYTNIY